MRRKIGVTAAEMLQLREQGISNHDIAKLLDISYQTVLRYIGGQDGKMERLAAFKDSPPPKKEQEAVKPMIPKYEPKPAEETFHLGTFRVTLCHDDQAVIIFPPGNHSFLVNYNELPDLVQFLAWAMRTRMEVTADGEENQLKTEGRTV